VCIHGQEIAFVGDCLFAGSIGRTDLPLSSPGALARSLERLLTLPDDTTVYSGHGPATTIGTERVNNPFLNGSVRLLERER
jgi:glyoxylase-like metal-dependent hydrolase (beta-lactamase superfamily II)